MIWRNAIIDLCKFVFSISGWQLEQIPNFLLYWIVKYIRHLIAFPPFFYIYLPFSCIFVVFCSSSSMPNCQHEQTYPVTCTKSTGKRIFALDLSVSVLHRDPCTSTLDIKKQFRKCNLNPSPPFNTSNSNHVFTHVFESSMKWLQYIYKLYIACGLHIQTEKNTCI